MQEVSSPVTESKERPVSWHCMMASNKINVIFNRLHMTDNEQEKWTGGKKASSVWKDQEWGGTWHWNWTILYQVLLQKCRCLQPICKAATRCALHTANTENFEPPTQTLNV